MSELDLADVAPTHSQKVMNWVSKLSNLLDGKVLYAFGTSIVNGHLANVSFVEDIARANRMVYRKFAVNGAASRTTDSNNIVKQICEAPDERPDLIVFDSIANDAYVEVTDNPAVFGQITDGFDDDFAAETYCGALETICRLLLRKYQGAKILYIATHKTPARDYRVQQIMHDVSVRICHKWSIRVADVYNESGFNGFVKQYQLDYSYDTTDTDGGNHATGGTGTHPNADGYRLFYDPIITANLLTLVS